MTQQPNPPEPNPDYETICRMSFESCVKRLARLIDLKAPRILICIEIEMIRDRAKALYGDVYYRAMGERERGKLRQAYGFCPTCLESPNPLYDGANICDECRESVKDLTS